LLIPINDHGIMPKTDSKPIFKTDLISLKTKFFKVTCNSMSEVFLRVRNKLRRNILQCHIKSP
jgi:translation initiation factor IF-1